MAIIDFYIAGGPDFNTFLGNKKKKFLSEIEFRIKDAGIPLHEIGDVKEKSYGYGYDWGVLLVNFIIENKELQVFIRVGNAIIIAEKLYKLLKRDKNKTPSFKHPKINFGLESSKFIAVKILTDMYKLNNKDKLSIEYCKMLTRPEISISEKEFIFIFRLDSKDAKKHHDAMFNDEKESLENIFIVHMDWEGNPLEVKRY